MLEAWWVPYGLLCASTHWVNVLHRVLPYLKGRERAQALKRSLMAKPLLATGGRVIGSSE